MLTNADKHKALMEWQRPDTSGREAWAFQQGFKAACDLLASAAPDDEQRELFACRAFLSNLGYVANQIDGRWCLVEHGAFPAAERPDLLAVSAAPAEGRETTLIDEEDEFQDWLKTRKGKPTNAYHGWMARAALSTAPTMSEAALNTLRKAAACYDDWMSAIGGCSDGGCLIKRPTGMHTNGGCRCPSDKMKMQRAMHAASLLRDAVAEIERIDRAAEKGESDE